MSPRGAGWIRSPLWGGAAVAFAGVVLATLSVAPRVWMSTLLPLLQPHVTLWYLGAGLLSAAGLVLWALRAPRRRGAASLALVGVLLGYVALLYGYYAGEPPAKKFHLLQYGVLAGLTLQAVRVDEESPGGLVAGLVFLVVIGTADEVAQGYIPMRTFRWLDLFGNYLGSALGVLAWLAASPHSPFRRPPGDGT
ncbi:hypothetical protein FBQ97_01925 [Acidobacteria bacterium ACD]|nr:hypothetical protein [Acidobacteria bacterium ACD]